MKLYAILAIANGCGLALGLIPAKGWRFTALACANAVAVAVLWGVGR